MDTIELLSICTKHSYDKEPIYKKDTGATG